MAIGQVKTRLVIVDDQQSSCFNFDVDEDADVDVLHNVGIFAFSYVLVPGHYTASHNAH